jgi:gliding motility-associated-like protein
MFRLSLFLFTLCISCYNLVAQVSAWKGYVRYFDNAGVYQKENDLPACSYVTNGQLRIEPASVTNKNLYYTIFEYIAPICLPDNFSYEIKVKNNKALNGFSSYDVVFGMLSPNGTTECTLMGEPSAQSYTSLSVNNDFVASNNPVLVLDFSNWATIKLQFKNNVITYSHNGKPFFTAPYSGNICNLEGLYFRLKGSAAVDFLRITNDDDNTQVYFEDFTNCSNMASPTGCNPTVLVAANTPCEGDSLKLSTTTRATLYEWSGPNNFKASQPTLVIPKASPSLGGTYFLKAKLNACQTISNSVEVKINALPKVSLGRDTAFCNGQVYNLDAKNIGSTYKWQDGTTQRFLTAKKTDDYAVTVTNTEGCRASDTVNVVVAANPILATVTVKKPQCFNQCNGEATAKGSGGFGAPFAYTWSGGRTGANLIGRCAGDIGLTVTDSKGCAYTSLITITQPSRIDVKVVPNEVYNGFAVSCPESDDGQAVVQAVGGNGGYNYVWLTNPLQFTKSVSNLRADTTYKVFVFDRNGCNDSTTFSLTAPPKIEGDFTVKNARCNGEKSGIITLDTIRGGVGSYHYFFNEKKYSLEEARQFSGLGGGEYTFALRDTNNCSVNKKLTVLDPPKLKIIGTPDTLIHFGDSLLLIANVEGPSVLSSVKWILGRDSSGFACRDCPSTYASPRVTTFYKMMVKDTFGCEAQKQILVSVDKRRRVFAPNIFSPNGDGENDSFTLFVGTGAKKVMKFSIFNRWGAMIHDCRRDMRPDDGELSWDGLFNGSISDSDTYVWLAEIEFEDGDTEVFKGDFTLVR